MEGGDQQTSVVILGSGLVSGPVVEYFSREKNIAVTVGMLPSVWFLTLSKSGKVQFVNGMPVPYNT